MKRVIIAGVGPGSKSCLTEEVKEAIDNSEVLIGSKRLIEEYTDKKTFYAVTAKDIIDIIDNENANVIYDMRPNVAKVVSGSIFNESTWEWEDAKDISW